MKKLSRRAFLGSGLLAASTALLGKESSKATTIETDFVAPTIAFPQKKPLKAISDRPPLLESPRDIFTQAVTPNDMFFVRWHMPDIPTFIDLNTFRLEIKGHVNKPLSLSVDDLKSKFEPVEVMAVQQCGGNSRKNFIPVTTGVQWGHGAMGNALWRGVRLKDLLNAAGLKEGSEYIGVSGLEKPALEATPKFFRELNMQEALHDSVIVAYEMNGEDLPYLNGFPLKLIIPGHFADSWIKMLSEITVLDRYKNSFFMDTAYRVPDNDCECVVPGSAAQYSKKPITLMKVKSVIGYPSDNAIIKKGSKVQVTGVAFDEGYGIKEVMVSTDGGKSWEKAKLDKDLGKYSFRKWTFEWNAKTKGKTTIMVRAVNRIGRIQPLHDDAGWNPGGYQYNGVDSVNVVIA